MKKALIAIVAAGALVMTFAVAAVHAAGKSEGFQTRRAQFLARHIADDLNLTDDQRAQIKEILVNERPTIQALAQKIVDQNEQMHSRTTYDDAFVHAAAQQQAANLADAIVEREKIRARILAILNADQQQKLNQISAEVRAVVEDRVAHLGDGL